jgi:4-hydroxybenzoate polyprenyltransferase
MDTSTATTPPSVTPPAPPPTSAIHQARTFLDLIKFAHSIFALPFALVGTFLASRAIGLRWPGWGRLGLILICMVFARTMAMTVNRLVDRKYDATNPRTARRPSVTGAVSPAFMLLAMIVCSLGFLAGCSGFAIWFGNFWPLILALPVLAWLALYSFTKRFTALCHFWLGISLGMAPVAAWIAIVPPRGPLLSLPILLLGVAVVCWVAGFDILYALQDETIDRTTGLHSIPAATGRSGALWLSRGCHVLCIAALALVGVAGGLHLLYAAAVLIVAVLLVIEQSLVSPTDISRVNIAFMTVNGIVGLVFGALAIADILL